MGCRASTCVGTSVRGLPGDTSTSSFVTGFGDGNRFIEAIRAGADDVQRKPVDLDELEARLVIAARTLDLHRRLDGPSSRSQ